MAIPSNVKMIVSGNVIEFYHYEKPIWTGGNNEGGRKKEGEETITDQEENRKTSTRRARNNFRRLVLANFNNKSKFITLTFRDTDKLDIRNVSDTNKEFKKFIQRMKRRYGDFKYISVIEFQDKTRNGVVHYHMMCELPYIPHETLADIWGLGHIGINAIDNNDNVGAYLTKYMMKDTGEPRLQGKKCYLASRNLEKPMEFTGWKAEEIYKEYVNKKNTVYSSSYTSEHNGKISYKEYNLKRGK